MKSLREIAINQKRIDLKYEAVGRGLAELGEAMLLLVQSQEALTDRLSKLEGAFLKMEE